MAAYSDKEIFKRLLDEVDDTLVDFEQRCLRLEGFDSSQELPIIFRAAHNIKGACQPYGQVNFANAVHILEDLISVLSERGSKVEARSVDVLLEFQVFLRQWIEELRENPQFNPDVKPLRDLVQNEIHRLKGLPVVEVAAAVEGKAIVSSPDVLGPQQQIRRRRSGNLKVPSSRIDEIMQVIGELAIQQSILSHGQLTDSLNSPLCKNAVQLNKKAIKELQGLVLALRMQPIETLFNRIEHLTRDIARSLGKNVKIEFSGSEVVMDKTLIELIVDPIVHLVKNAIDHGIEEEALRIANGKNPVGVLRIEAQSDTGQVILTVSDDGGGINSARVLAKARNLGIVGLNENLSEEEIYQLIFHAGVSTRQEANEVSGRGVGMDVVHQSIQQLSGQIEIYSQIDKGTSFVISLPTSLEIVDGMIVRLGSERFIIPVQDVDEIVNLGEVKTCEFGATGTAILLREQIIPLENLDEYIGFHNPEEMTPAQEKMVALVVELRDRSLIAFAVDEVIVQQSIVVRPLSDQLVKLPAFSGVTILGNGEPGMIVSLPYVGDCYLNWIRQQRRSA